VNSLVALSFQNTISDLFAAPTGLTSLVEARKSSFASTPVTATSVAPNISERNFEQVGTVRRLCSSFKEGCWQ